MISRPTRVLLMIFSLCLTSLAILPQKASAVHWTVEGPGVTDLIVTGNKVIFSYDLDVRRSYGVFEWQLTGHDFNAGTHVFDWDYDGSHDNAQKATILRAETLELVSAKTGTGVFLYEGRDLALKTNKTDDLRFRMLATNNDATHTLSGTLELTIQKSTASEFPALPFIPAKPFPETRQIDRPTPFPVTNDLQPAKPFPISMEFEAAEPFPVAAVPLPLAFWPFAASLIALGLGSVLQGRRSVLRNNPQI